MRADVLEDEVQVLAAQAGRLHELLLGHAAQLQAADVEVAERDAVGVQLVLVAAELEPLPDVALSPVLGVHGRPVGVAGYTRGERSEGRRPLQATFCSAVKTRGDPTLRVDFRAGEGMTGRHGLGVPRSSFGGLERGELAQKGETRPFNDSVSDMVSRAQALEPHKPGFKS